MEFVRKEESDLEREILREKDMSDIEKHGPLDFELLEIKKYDNIVLLTPSASNDSKRNGSVLH